MTRRIVKRSVLEVKEISPSVLQNHPLPEPLDDSSSTDTSISNEARKISSMAYRGGKNKEIWHNREKNIPSESSCSEATRGTISSCSWGDDEFEREITTQVQEMLDGVDEVLYEGKKPPGITVELYQDNLEWAKKYPYLRIIGQQVAQPVDDSISYFPAIPVGDLSCQAEDASKTQRLLLKGKQMQILTFSADDQCLLVEENDDDEDETKEEIEEVKKEESVDKESSDVEDVLPDYIEEVFEMHGTFEEFLACGKGEDKSEELKKNPEATLTPAFSDVEIEVLKERIINRLMDGLWPEVLTLWEAVEESHIELKSGFEQERLLPPIIGPTSKGPSRPSSQVRSRSGYSSYRSSHQPIHDDFSKLDGILTVSSKVLQVRKDMRASTVDIPDSRIPSAARYRAPRQIDLPSLYMPPVEENSSSLPDILCGTRFGSEIYTSTSPVCNLNKSTRSFLPPIFDTVHSRNKQNTNLHSRSVIGVSDKVHKGRYLNTSDSRPSTSRSCRRNAGQTSYKSPPLVSDLGLYLGYGMKTPTSPFPKGHNHLPLLDESALSHGHHRVVTLFPLVTPLNPPGRGSSENEKSKGRTRKSSQSRIFSASHSRR